MKIKHQLSIAMFVLAGIFATGCSQQSAGGSQIAGGSQSQIEGGTQMAGSQQQAETPPPVVTPPPAAKGGNCHTHPANAYTRTIRHCHPNPTGKHRYGGMKRKPMGHNKWTHVHPAIPGCTNSIRHTHKYKNRNHTHHYSCKGKRRHYKRHYTGGNKWTHVHPAIPGCTNSIRHTHKYKNRNHTHHYSCKGMRHAKQEVDVYALQRKLKAKGYYKGPIDGVVGPATRSALKRFMNR